MNYPEDFIKKIICGDSMEIMKQIPGKEIDILYCDPPYGLGSEVIIRPDGKPDYLKASDFMSKWDMPTGEYWENWYKEAFRILKYGGYCLMFGMDRQLLLFKYYASFAGFCERQSLYWFFISNFPKASDLSKNLDKNAGIEREVIGKHPNPAGSKGNTFPLEQECNITAPSSPLAKKYSGYKYSISPLKQTNETIMVFQKPYKTGSCMHDVLAYENGDTDCGCGVLNVDGNRCGIEKIKNQGGNKTGQNVPTISKDWIESEHTGRYPAQTFVSPEAGEVLDGQSGVKNGSDSKGGGNGGIWTKGNKKQVSDSYPDSAGCSKILHKCAFEEGEHDLYFYCPKVSKNERNKGCEEMENKKPAYETHRANYETTHGIETPYAGTGRSGKDFKNNHPTLKPLSLNMRILKLFKTPNPQKILIPFCGAGSEIKGAMLAGFKDWIGIEINAEYIEIALKRLSEYDNELF